MTLNFVLGENRFDHHKKMMELFKADYDKDPQGQFFFLVPNHIKFESEVNVLNELGQLYASDNDHVFASHSVQTFSFSRLAWYFLRGNSNFNAETLTQTKAAMMLKNIVQENKKDLKIFSGMIDKPGFMDQMISQFNEFMNGQVQPDDIYAVLGNNDEDFFSDKIKELTMIYEKYLQQVENFNTNDFQLNALAEYLNTDLSKYHFYIEGFSNFTAAEANLVKSMILNSSNLDISLVLDRPYLNDQLAADEFFYRSASTYQQLSQFAKQFDVAIHNEFAKELRVNQDIATLEKYWLQSSGVAPIEASKIDHTAVQIWKCTDIQTEVSIIGNYIRQKMAMNKDYRYKDFLILARNLSDYESFIESFMENNEIPYFIDLQKKMANHPFKRLIDLLFAIYNHGMQEDDVISLLRTELLLPEIYQGHVAEYRRAVDLTENFVLANGITKKGWLGDDFTLQDGDKLNKEKKSDRERLQDLATVNQIKHFIQTIYQALEKFMNNKTTQSATTIITKLYNFLEENNVFKTLLAWQQMATEQNDLALANQPQQIVNLFNQILDEYVSEFGDQDFKSKDFITILDSAFENADYSQIPSTLDAVSISEIGMIQPNNRKITFILGATSTNMPGTTVSNDLVTDDERDFLNRKLTDGKYLRESDKVTNNAEPFLHDITFTTGKEQLIFTYPNLTADNVQQELSSYVTRIKKHFHLEEQLKLLNPIPEENLESTETDRITERDVLSYVGSRSATLNYLIRVYRNAEDKRRAKGTKERNISNAWRYVSKHLLGDNDSEEAQFVNDSLNYRNSPHALQEDTVAKLYGDELNVSISQLESFYANQYEYFLKYGLRIRPRELFEINAATTGSLYHAFLDSLVKYLKEENLNLREMNDPTIQNVVHDLYQTELAKPSNRIYQSSPRMNYLSDKFEATLLQLVKNMHLQYQRNQFNPKASEVTFGPVKSTKKLIGPSWELNTKNHNRINVNGKIDRIDMMRIDDVDYLVVVDYKSSNKTFDLAGFEAGITMQMPTYFWSLQNNLNQPILEQILGVSDSDSLKVGGALYEHITNPTVKENKIIADSNIEVLKGFKMNGILLDDFELRDKFDTTFEPVDHKKTKTKDAYQSLKPSPTIDRNGKKTLFTEDELNDILQYNQYLIEKAGENIYSGELKLNPYRKGQISALKYSDFQPIFQFDAMLDENEYHDIVDNGKKDILKAIREKLDKETEDDGE